MTIEEAIRKRSDREALLAVLLDPAKLTRDKAREMAAMAERGGADLIFVGGSIGAALGLDNTILGAKEGSNLPIILFPGNVDGISPHADAILFMSLLNSSNPYWIVQAQALAAPLIKKLGMEVLPTAYLIIEPGHSSAAGWVGWVNPIPRMKPEIALAYAMAAELLGMRWIYLEAGSGAEYPVPVEMVAAIKGKTNLGLIVGGGLHSPKQVEERAKAGADIVVVGTHIEGAEDIEERVRVLKERTLK